MQGVNYLIPLLTLPYLTRILGLYNYGALSTAITFIQYAVLFVDFGFNFTATKKIADNSRNRALVSKVFWETIISKCVLAFLAIILCGLIIGSTPKFEPLAILFLIMTPQILGSALFPVWLFQGLEKLSVISIATMLTKLTTIPLLFLMVKTAEDIKTAAIILALPLFLSSLITSFYIYRNRLVEFFPISDLRLLSALKDSFPLFVGTIAISLYILSTPLILSFTSNFSEVGLFVASDKLRTAFIGIFLILGQAIYPRVNVILSEDRSRYWSFIKKLTKLQLALCTVAAILFYAFAPMIAPLLLGNDFHELGKLLKVMAPMIIIVPASVILGNFILLPHGKNKLYAMVPMVIAFLHVIYSFVFCYYWGAFGGAISILLSEILSFLLFFSVCYTYIKPFKGIQKND